MNNSTTQMSNLLMENGFKLCTHQFEGMTLDRACGKGHNLRVVLCGDSLNIYKFEGYVVEYQVTNISYAVPMEAVAAMIEKMLVNS